MRRTAKKQQNKKAPSGSSGFFAFAIFVFSALIAGLIIILLRSKA